MLHILHNPTSKVIFLLQNCHSTQTLLTISFQKHKISTCHCQWTCRFYKPLLALTRITCIPCLRYPNLGLRTASVSRSQCQWLLYCSLSSGRVEQGQAERENRCQSHACGALDAILKLCERTSFAEEIRVAFVVKGMLHPKKMFIDYTSARRSFFRGTRESFTAGLAD